MKSRQYVCCLLFSVHSGRSCWTSCMHSLGFVNNWRVCSVEAREGGGGQVCSGWGGALGLRGGGPGEQQLALSRGPGEGAGEEVSIALLLQRLPDTGSEGTRRRRRRRTGWEAWRRSQSKISEKAQIEGNNHHLAKDWTEIRELLCFDKTQICHRKGGRWCCFFVEMHQSNGLSVQILIILITLDLTA